MAVPEHVLCSIFGKLVDFPPSDQRSVVLPHTLHKVQFLLPKQDISNQTIVFIILDDYYSRSDAGDLLSVLCPLCHAEYGAMPNIGYDKVSLPVWIAKCSG